MIFEGLHCTFKNRIPCFLNPTSGRPTPFCHRCISHRTAPYLLWRSPTSFAHLLTSQPSARRPACCQDRRHGSHLQGRHQGVLEAPGLLPRRHRRRAVQPATPHHEARRWRCPAKAGGRRRGGVCAAANVGSTCSAAHGTVEFPVLWWRTSQASKATRSRSSPEFRLRGWITRTRAGGVQHRWWVELGLGGNGAT